MAPIQATGAHTGSLGSDASPEDVAAAKEAEAEAKRVAEAAAAEAAAQSHAKAKTEKKAKEDAVWEDMADVFNLEDMAD